MKTPAIRAVIAGLLFATAASSASAEATRITVFGPLASTPDQNIFLVGGHATLISMPVRVGSYVRVSGFLDQTGILVSDTVTVVQTGPENLENAEPYLSVNRAISDHLVSPTFGVTGTNIAGVTGTNIEGVTGTNIEGVTGTNIEGVTGTNIAGVTGTNIEGVTGTNIAGVTGTNIEGVTGTNIAGVTGTNIEGVTGTNIAGVTGTNIEGVTGTNIAGVTGTNAL